MQGNRIPYLDTTKGLLIIFVIVGHVINLSTGIIAPRYIEHMAKVNPLFVPYFMQAFFFITGYCSSFNKGFKQTLLSNIKSLLLPFVTFCILNQLIRSIFFNESFLFVYELGKKFFFLVELFWFLSAMFIAKMLYWCICRCNNYFIQGLIIALLFSGAVYLNGRHVHSYNYFHWHNAICNLPFLYLGSVAKEYDFITKLGKWVFASIPLYLLLLYVIAKLGISLPSYSHYPHFYWQQAHWFILIACVGTLMILAVGKLLSSNKILTFYGENTLIIYGTHFSVLALSELMLSKLMSVESIWDGTAFYILSLLSTLIISFFLCLIFQKKPFNYLIGKF